MGDIEAEATRRLDNFLRQPMFRHKLLTSDVGRIIGMCSISSKYAWADICEAFVSETSSRHVMWYVKRSPVHGRLPALQHAKNSPRKTRTNLRQLFDLTQTSRQWLMFQVLFLTKVA